MLNMKMIADEAWRETPEDMHRFKQLAEEINHRTGCFTTAGPTMWNSLPEQLRQPEITCGLFK